MAEKSKWLHLFCRAFGDSRPLKSQRKVRQAALAKASGLTSNRLGGTNQDSWMYLLLECNKKAEKNPLWPEGSNRGCRGFLGWLQRKWIENCTIRAIREIRGF